MLKATIILLGLALFVWASARSPNKGKLTWFQLLKGWQKIFGVVAVILTLLIVLNPEFLPLGLLGDTAFFDMLVLALSLQLHQYATLAFRVFARVLSRGARSLGIPSPRFSYALAVLSATIASVLSTLHKAAHRIFS